MSDLPRPRPAMPAEMAALDKGEEYRRGWRVLAASALGAGVGVAPIAAYSLGALVTPLVAEFGWTRADVTAAALFKSIGVILVGAAAGGLADRFGARRVALISQLCLAAGLALLSLVDGRIVTLYAGYTLLALLGAGTLPMIWGRAIIGWFVAGRGLALGISLAGTGIAGTLLPTYVSYLVSEFGWRGAYLGLAVLPLVIGLPIVLLWFREPPTDPAATRQAPAAGGAVVIAPNSGYRFRDAISTVCFWQMSIAFVIVSIAISGVLVHALPLMTDRGIAPAVAAMIAGLFGLSVLFGRLVSGFLIDRFPAPLVSAGMFAAAAAACALLLQAGGNPWLCGVAIIMVGLSAGAESDIAAYLTAQYFGRRHYGAIYGLLYTLFGVGSGIGPYLVGLSFDRHGNYDLAALIGIAAFLCGATLIGFTRPPVARAKDAAA